MAALLKGNASKGKLLIALVVSVTIFAFGLFAFQAINDPLVNYYGSTLRNSELMAQVQSSLYCQQLSSFSFGANFTCFNSKEELNNFAARLPR